MRRRWRQALAVLLAICFLIMPCHAQSWWPDTATVKKLEAGNFPKLGQSPDLSRYARYYTGLNENGHHVIAGELISWVDDSRPAGVHIVASEKEFPVIFDGGCSVIHIHYDVDTSQITRLTCNGRA